MSDRGEMKNRRVARCKEQSNRRAPVPEDEPNQNGDRIDPIRAELERVAMGEATSGRAQLAKVTALRTLDKIARRRTVPSCPPDWHPAPPEREELDRLYLERHPEVRERWWRELHREGLL
jgi:hypothetical protein